MIILQSQESSEKEKPYNSSNQKTSSRLKAKSPEEFPPASEEMSTSVPESKLPPEK